MRFIKVVRLTGLNRTFLMHQRNCLLVRAVVITAFP